MNASLGFSSPSGKSVLWINSLIFLKYSNTKIMGIIEKLISKPNNSLFSAGFESSVVNKDLGHTMMTIKRNIE